MLIDGVYLCGKHQHWDGGHEPTCSLCDAPVRARGWCWLHLQNFYRYGAPEREHQCEAIVATGSRKGLRCLSMCDEQYCNMHLKLREEAS